MTLNKNKLYSMLFIACLAGYVYIYVSLIANETHKSFDVCLVKHATTLPCPSCGSTRAIILLTKGDFVEALRINPLGYVVALIMFLAPSWIALDMATKRKTLFDFYRRIEIYLRRPYYAIPLIGLVLINWIWNISKGL